MKVYLAGAGWEKIWLNDEFYNFHRLQTYCHLTDQEKKVIHKYKGFLLDSGAFSFFGGKKVDWSEYTSSYIKFINDYDVKHFFELDIYSIIGIDNTLKLRDKIEKETGKQTIPVWHKFLGIQFYKNLCDNYKYIAIGASGMHGTEWTRKNPEILKSLVDYANNKKVKVHGLGYTNLKQLQVIKFHSVDSTSWLSGNRFGAVYNFNGQGLDKVNKPAGKRVITNKTAKHNFTEWVKYSNYAYLNL
jgi:hypothetical protein